MALSNGIRWRKVLSIFLSFCLSFYLSFFHHLFICWVYRRKPFCCESSSDPPSDFFNFLISFFFPSPCGLHLSQRISTQPKEGALEQMCVCVRVCVCVCVC